MQDLGTKLLARIIADGALTAIIGILAGLACGWAFEQVARNCYLTWRTPRLAVLAGAASILVLAAVAHPAHGYMVSVTFEIVRGLSGLSPFSAARHAANVWAGMM